MDTLIGKDVYKVVMELKSPNGAYNLTEPCQGLDIVNGLKKETIIYNSSPRRKNGQANFFNISVTPEYIKFYYKVIPGHFTDIGHIVGGSISKRLYEDGWNKLSRNRNLFKTVSCVKVFDSLVAPQNEKTVNL